MKRFLYKAKTSDGRIIKGVIQAESERAAGKLLMDTGYVPESIKDESEQSLLGQSKKVSAKDRVTFTRSFATLIGAGLPLAQSLRTIIEETPDGAMKRVAEEILADVEAGRSLGDAFSKHPEVFNNVYLSLIKAGEVSGTLDNSLRRIAEQEEKDMKTRSKIKGAMMYPAIAFVVIILVFMYMTINVVPQVEELYRSLGAELPFLSKVLVGIKDAILNYWYLFLIGAVVLVVVLSRFLKTDVGIEFAANFKLKVPMFNKLFRIMYMARLTRTAQILLATGVAVLDTMAISGDAMDNIVVERSVTTAMDRVKAGKPLSESLKDQPYIMPLVPQMAAIGEQSGKMDEMLGKAAQVFEDDLEEKINTISTMIEPILLMALGGMAAVLVGGVLFPIYSLVTTIQH